MQEQRDESGGASGIPGDGGSLSSGSPGGRSLGASGGDGLEMPVELARALAEGRASVRLPAWVDGAVLGEARAVMGVIRSAAGAGADWAGEGAGTQEAGAEAVPSPQLRAEMAMGLGDVGEVPLGVDERVLDEAWERMGSRWIESGLPEGLRGVLAGGAVDVPEGVDEAVLAGARRSLGRRAVRGWVLASWVAQAAVWAGLATLAYQPLLAWLAPGAERVAQSGPADVDRSGGVDVLDAFAVARALKAGVATPEMDVTNDGAVDGRDVEALLALAVRLPGALAAGQGDELSLALSCCSETGVALGHGDRAGP